MAVNKTGCCVCLKILKWIPVLFIVLIIIWSYYAYVIELCVRNIQSTSKKTVYLVFFHFIFVMFCWSYWQTVFTNAGTVPPIFKIKEEDFDILMNHLDQSIDVQNSILNALAKKLPIVTVTINGEVRFCEKCRCIKPDRAHHCSVCGTCILKMDHHCPWINNCVGFTNYKFFILFLVYSLIYCMFIAFTSLQYFFVFWNGGVEGVGHFHILFMFFLAVMFGVSLMSLLGYHCYLITENRTTLESFRPSIFRDFGADKRGFFIGRLNNFKEVFGENKKLWWLPVPTSNGDGLTFPQRYMNEEQEGLL